MVPAYAIKSDKILIKSHYYVYTAAGVHDIMISTRVAHCAGRIRWTDLQKSVMFAPKVRAR